MVYEIREKLDSSLQDFIATLFKENQITTGNIMPEQAIEFETLKDKLAVLMAALIRQNRE
jgi:hypothetical protein